MEKITYRVEELGTVVGGGTPSTQTKEYWDGDIPWISPADLTGYTNVYISKGAKDITEEGLKKSSTKLLPKGTVLLSSRAPIGYLAIAENDICTNQGFKSIICNENIVNNKYLYYFLKLNVEHLKAFASGATFPELSGNRLKRIKLNIAKDIDAQKRIADILSTYDNLIENNNKRIAILEQMAKNLYKEWFVRLRFPGYETAEFENGFPKDWECLKISKVLTVFYGKDHSKLEEGDIPVYGSGGIMRYGSRALYEGESVLIPRKGSLNNIMWVNQPFWTVDTMFYTKALIPNVEKYIYYVLSSLDMASFNTGAALPSMTTDILYHLKIVLPSETLLARFDEIISNLYEQRTLLENKNNNLIKQRNLLLPRLMSGKLEV